MAVSVRLDKKTEGLLEKTAHVMNTTKSVVLKRSLYEYCYRVLEEKQKSPYSLVKDLVGKYGSGKGNLATDAKKILRETFPRRKR